MDVQRFKKAFAELEVSFAHEEGLYNQGEEEVLISAQSLTDVYDGCCFTWSTSTCSVLVVRRQNENKGGNNSASFRLVPIDSPQFPVSNLKVSSGGNWICISGTKGIRVIELPARVTAVSGCGDESGDILCRVLPVGERFYSSRTKNRIRQVLWHPEVRSHHLTVLSTDNNLRIFSLDEEPSSRSGTNDYFPGQYPEQTIQFDGGSRHSGGFGTSVLSVKAALGNTAVGFAFGQRVVGDDGGHWPVYALHGDGSVYFAMTRLGDDAIYQPNVVGPLKMVPASDDNYGQESCALLLLQPLVGVVGSCPPILVIATSSGILYHCIVLGQADRRDADQMCLHVYESIELELGFFNSEKPFNYPITLTADSSRPSRYLCSHGAGVHCVGLPMLSQLAQLASTADGVLSKLSQIPIAEEDSIVEHLICTDLNFAKQQQQQQRQAATAILGLAVVPTRLSSYLICILNRYKVEVVALSSETYFPNFVTKDSSSAGPFVSSSKKRPEREAFDSYLSRILQRSTNLPIIRASSATEVSSDELLRIVTKSTKVLREEYLHRLDKARSEIELKVRALGNMKRQQRTALIKLRQEQKCVKDKAGRLSHDFQRLQDNGNKLTSRLEDVLNNIQKQLPVLTDSELKMQRRLVEISRRMKDFKNGMEQVQTKEKYQLRQIQQSRNKLRQASDDGQRLKLGQNQLESIKDVLQSNSSDIQELIKQVNIAEKSLAM